MHATVVIDNAHRVSDIDIRALIEPSPHLHFVLLAQPGPAVAMLEATLGVEAEPLRGWTNETAAAEGSARGCHGNYVAYEHLIGLTAGLPLYVQNALQIAATNYEGDVARFCTELEQQTHVITTAQELILSRVFEGYGDDRLATAILSLVDVPLNLPEAAAILQKSCGLGERAVTALFRKLRTTGALQVFGTDYFKVHDAIRLLGRGYLESSGADTLRKARSAIRDMLVSQLPGQRSTQRVSLLLRMFVALDDVKPLVEMATDEIFHELGYMTEITVYLEHLAASDGVRPEDRFWALDGLVFAQFKKGDFETLDEKLSRMERLVTEHDLGASEKLAVAMKRMSFYAQMGNSDGAQAAMDAVLKALPDRPEYLRIARYNFARALFSLGDYEPCLEITNELILEYYGLLGLTPSQVTGNNPDKIFPLLKKGEDHTDDLKHLADVLDLQAMAVNRLGRPTRLERIHAMKFYSMAHALDSFVRVGQDLADEFVSRADYIGALDVLERNLLPTILHMKMASHIIPVRSQYAVVLAYSGNFAAADAEMARLAPYEAGLDDERRRELQGQRHFIARLKLQPPQPQWQIPHPSGKQKPNAPCFCGSGKKYKKCHGRRS
jgi:tetratricopeptide (TPR) repeat protein